MWRYTSVSDLKNILKASLLSSALIMIAILYLFHFQGYSRSVFILDFVFTFLFVSGIRLAIRLIFAEHVSSLWQFKNSHRNQKRLMIIGAGDAGEKVLREIQENHDAHFRAVGFLDDDINKVGKTIHGLTVIDTVEKLERLENEFDEIIIAIPSAKGAQMRRIVSLCEKTGKRFRTLPSISELIEGRISVNSLREVKLEDLFGRAEVRLDKSIVINYIQNKRVLITGAGGSIGSELVRQIGQFNPEALALVDFSEFNLFQADRECRYRFGLLKTRSFLTDVRNITALEKVVGEFRPQVIFHAAAYKHVPIQETNPWEAVYNNVRGTRNMAEMALKYQAERFVLVSTDKAVRPTNIMGATKRVGEMLVESMNGNKATQFMAVRFGNVIGSSGSAIPLFQEQISRGGPVTVTHPEITRYFMSIPEAAQLILQAGAMGKGGEIFILDMGNPVRIIDLVRDLIRLNGYEPNKDIPIEITGLRPGEKLFEELITAEEGIMPTQHKKILVLKGRSYDLENLNSQIDKLIQSAKMSDGYAIKELLREIVPEYSPQGNEKS
jgi:FlaA1/EpsC-like NDP-sugar epimerase